MLKAGYGSDLGEGGNMKLQAAFPLSVSIKTLRNAFAVICNEKLLVKAFFQLELRRSLPLESSSLEFGRGLGSKSSYSCQLFLWICISCAVFQHRSVSAEAAVS